MLEPPIPLSRIRIADVCKVVADYHHILVDELVGDAKQKWLAWIRFQAYLIAYETGKSSTAIGRVMRRDHSTVLYGVKEARKLMKEQPIFARHIRYLRKMAKQKAAQRKVFGNGGEE